MPNKKPPIDDILLTRARAMRHESAPAEAILWYCLRAHRLAGLKFRRQHVIGPFIADFYCHELKLTIELDGDSHSERREYDADRTGYLSKQGLRVLRFLNTDVFENLDAVLEEVLRQIEAVRNSPSP